MATTLTFTMQRQQQSNWCWLAVATSVSSYYTPASTWTQCGLANRQMTRNDCCTSPCPAACNRVGWTNDALNTVGNLASFQTSSVNFAALSAEIDGSRPLGMGVDWSGGGGHAVAISGYNTLSGGDQQMLVADPDTGGAAWVAYGTAYKSGTWRRTYYTQA